MRSGWKSPRYKRDKVLIGTNRVSREKYAFYSRTSVDNKSTGIRVAIHRKNFAGEEIHRRLHFLAQTADVLVSTNRRKIFSNDEDDVAFYDFDFLLDCSLEESEESFQYSTNGKFSARCIFHPSSIGIDCLQLVILFFLSLRKTPEKFAEKCI